MKASFGGRLTVMVSALVLGASGVIGGMGGVQAATPRAPSQAESVVIQHLPGGQKLVEYFGATSNTQRGAELNAVSEGIPGAQVSSSASAIQSASSGWQWQYASLAVYDTFGIDEYQISGDWAYNGTTTLNSPSSCSGDYAAPPELYQLDYCDSWYTSGYYETQKGSQVQEYYGCAVISPYCVSSNFMFLRIYLYANGAHSTSWWTQFLW